MTAARYRICHTVASGPLPRVWEAQSAAKSCIAASSTSQPAAIASGLADSHRKTSFQTELAVLLKGQGRRGDLKRRRRGSRSARARRGGRGSPRRLAVEDVDLFAGI